MRTAIQINLTVNGNLSSSYERLARELAVIESIDESAAVSKMEQILERRKDFQGLSYATQWMAYLG